MRLSQSHFCWLLSPLGRASSSRLVVSLSIVRERIGDGTSPYALCIRMLSPSPGSPLLVEERDSEGEPSGEYIVIFVLTSFVYLGLVQFVRVAHICDIRVISNLLRLGLAGRTHVFSDFIRDP